MSVRVTGIGTCVPSGVLEQGATASTAARLAGRPEKEAVVRKLFERSGVSERRSVLADAQGSLPFFEQGHVPTTGERMSAYTREAPALTHGACAQALADAGVHAGDVTHLVVVSCTGFESPGVDLAAIESLGLRPTVRRTIVGMMGCHGAINGLAAARAFAAESADHVVLMVCVELCTLHFCASVEHGAMVANARFGDGAAACVGAQGERGRELASCSSVVVPGTASDMGWVGGDNGFEMTLASGVPSKLAERTPAWIDGWLAEHGLTREGVAGWAVHPGGPRVLDEVGEALALPDGALDVSREVLRTRGNMSSGTVLFILERMRAAEGPVAVLAFGPGLCAEGALLR